MERKSAMMETHTRTGHSVELACQIRIIHKIASYVPGRGDGLPDVLFTKSTLSEPFLHLLLA